MVEALRMVGSELIWMPYDNFGRRRSRSYTCFSSFTRIIATPSPSLPLVLKGFTSSQSLHNKFLKFTHFLFHKLGDLNNTPLPLISTPLVSRSYIAQCKTRKPLKGVFLIKFKLSWKKRHLKLRKQQCFKNKGLGFTIVLECCDVLGETGNNEVDNSIWRRTWHKIRTYI